MGWIYDVAAIPLWKSTQVALFHVQPHPSCLEIMAVSTTNVTHYGIVAVICFLLEMSSSYFSNSVLGFCLWQSVFVCCQPKGLKSILTSAWWLQSFLSQPQEQFGNLQLNHQIHFGYRANFLIIRYFLRQEILKLLFNGCLLKWATK